jgi:hypothetical protein
VPTAAATIETDEKTSRDKFITCILLAGVDTKKYGRLKTELNNAYVAEQNNYPKRRECRDNVVTLHEQRGSSSNR